jgi:hypothetical protein
MEQRRGWLIWVALGMAGLALVLALGGRMAGGMGIGRMHAGYAPAVGADPRSERGGPPAFAQGHERGGPSAFAQGHGRGHGEQSMGMPFGGAGQRHGFAPLMMLFGLINALSKLVALGLLGWLLLRLFQQWRDGGSTPPLAASGPTTPAGHDPRVE